MKLYGKNQWKEFQQSVIELDGNKCTVCGREKGEVILQVHHKKYIKRRKPWEYATSDCVTLCKGCHATEHGLIMPQFGWEYTGDDDLGDLSGTCEKCGTSIRYVFYIFHEKWGNLEVGTYCCDILTDTKIASNKIESMKSYEGRRDRFTGSKRWKQNGDNYSIRQSLFDIQIQETEKSYFLTIHNLKSEKAYDTLLDAQTAAFRVIESGELIEYLKKHHIQFEEPKRKKRK
jgi:hypothetical protein